jgi:hypothetical protein
VFGEDRDSIESGGVTSTEFSGRRRPNPLRQR